MVIFNKNLFAVLVGFCILCSSFVGAMEQCCAEEKESAAWTFPSLKTCCLKNIARNPLVRSLAADIVAYHDHDKQANLSQAFLDAVDHGNAFFVQDCLAHNARKSQLEQWSLDGALLRLVSGRLGRSSMAVACPLIDQGADVQQEGIQDVGNLLGVAYACDDMNMAQFVVDKVREKHGNFAVMHLIDTALCVLERRPTGEHIIGPVFFGALRHHKKKWLQFFLDNGASLGVVNYCDENALHVMANFINEWDTARNYGWSLQEMKELMHTLFDRGANPNAVDLLGATPLYHTVCCAAKTGAGSEKRALYEEFFKGLVEHGADVTITDKWGETPQMCLRHLPQSEGKAFVTDFLKKAELQQETSSPDLKRSRIEHG